jgi:single-strand DNA-binding protein
MFKNHVDLIGFLGSDPETRRLENGAQLTSLSLATKTSWKNDAGSYDSRTEWHRIAVWGKLAQFAASLTKGAHIEVEGQLRHRIYQKQIQAGKKSVAVDVTVAEIHATAIRKLDRNGSSANSAEDESEEAPEQGAWLLII